MSFTGSKSTSKPKAVSQYTPGQFDVLNQLTGLLTGQIGQGVSAYPGTYTPGASPLQTQAFGQIGDILSGGGKYGGVAESGAGILQSIMKEYDPTLAMQYWEKGVKDPAMRTWREEMMPGIMEKYAGANALESSGLRKELVSGGENLASNLGGTLANILLQEKGQTQQNQLSAANLGLNYANMPLEQALQGLLAGTTQRGITAEQMQEPYQKWLSEQGYSNPWLSYLQTALGAQPYQVAQKYEQGSFGGGYSGGCCFIVIQGEGQLTENVRYVRDLICDQLKNNTIGKGYKRLASVLVPMMKRSKFIHRLVRFTMTRPISIFSDWFIEKRMSKILLIPLGLFWLSIFNALGGGKVLNIPKTARIMLGKIKSRLTSGQVQSIPRSKNMLPSEKVY